MSVVDINELCARPESLNTRYLAVLTKQAEGPFRTLNLGDLQWLLHTPVLVSFWREIQRLFAASKPSGLRVWLFRREAPCVLEDRCLSVVKASTNHHLPHT